MTSIKVVSALPTYNVSAGVFSDEPDHSVATAARVLDEILKYYRPLAGRVRAKAECLLLVSGRGPTAIQEALATLPSDWSDHAIACVYAVLMSRSRRKLLGAYFTPPHLVEHLLGRMMQLGVDITRNRIRDPAAGGAAFLVPLARRMVALWRAQDVSDRKIISMLRERLLGIEIDQGLGDIANALLRRMLTQEWKFHPNLVMNLNIILKGDSLSKRLSSEQPDHEVGNPPYRRLLAAEHGAMFRRFSDIASGRLNLYAIFVRRALAEVPAGGLVGHVVPASFLGGPEFSVFRQRLLQLAEVLVIDLVDQRNDVFVDATQDACFVVLRRRHRDSFQEWGRAASGVLHADGRFTPTEDMRLAFDGSPWLLPGPDDRLHATLEDWGYRVRVGYLVSYRQSARMHGRPGKGRFPLIWAKAVGQDGTFDHSRGASETKLGWVSAPADAAYVIREPCVVVQRTSCSRCRARRFSAAAWRAGGRKSRAATGAV